MEKAPSYDNKNGQPSFSKRKEHDTTIAAGADQEAANSMKRPRAADTRNHHDNSSGGNMRETHLSDQYYHEINARDQSTVIAGNVSYNIQLNEYKGPDEILAFGLCLGQAPRIDLDKFVGRATELDMMSQILQPGYQSTEQLHLVLGGMGGIGKTQMAIAYAQRHQHCYTSAFWLNATSKQTLQLSFRLVAGRFLKAQDAELLNNEQILVRVHEWLSDTRNTQWLLIFDNYDDPDQFDIGEYCPYAAHGSIVITSRLPDHVNGQQVRVQPLSNIEESLEILQTRSRRENVKNGKSVYTVRNVKTNHLR